MKYIQIVKLICSLLPVLIQAIKVAEEEMPGKGKGEAKLAIVRGVLESAYKISTDTIGAFDDVWPALSQTISVIVAAYNKTGTFK